MEIAILITSHNRKETTLKCLSALYEQKEKFDVFLVDDGSTDGTGFWVKELFPQVNVINGTGHLFWNGGMRLAWKKALKTKSFDFFLWLNDDTLLMQNSINELLSCYYEVYEKTKLPSIIVGTCCNSNNDISFSYGGRDDNGPILPDGKIKECKYINGNVVLIPYDVYNVVGNLSADYTHGMGDYDYGLRAREKGVMSYITRQYICTCPVHDKLPEWCDPKVPLVKRLKLLYSVRGLNIIEYNKFRKKFWGNKWLIFNLKAHLKALCPRLYRLIVQKKDNNGFSTSLFIYL